MTFVNMTFVQANKGWKQTISELLIHRCRCRCCSGCLFAIYTYIYIMFVVCCLLSVRCLLSSFPSLCVLLCSLWSLPFVTFVVIVVCCLRRRRGRRCCRRRCCCCCCFGGQCAGTAGNSDEFCTLQGQIKMKAKGAAISNSLCEKLVLS